MRYATTLGTNALIERKGPGSGAGHPRLRGHDPAVARPRLRRGARSSKQQNLPAAQRPEPLVPPQLIRSVRERINSAGKVVCPLDETTCARRCASSSTTAPRPSWCRWPKRPRTPSTSCGSGRSSSRSTRRTCSARSRCCWRTRSPAARASTCAPPRRSSTASCTRSCSTRWASSRTTCATPATTSRCWSSTTPVAWRS